MSALRVMNTMVWKHKERKLVLVEGDMGKGLGVSEVDEMVWMLSLFAHDLKDGLCLYRKI